MVFPITGPFGRPQSAPGPTNMFGYTPTWFVKNQSWRRQNLPHNLPLEYHMLMQRVVSSSDTWTLSQEYWSAEGPPQETKDAAYDKAYKKFVEAVRGETSALAVGLAEIKQSVSMIEKRAIQLAKVAVAVKRLRFVEAAHLLGLSAKSGGVFRKEGVLFRKLVVKKGRGRFRKGTVLTLDTRKTAKAFANNWLEYSFGWAPSVSDVYNAVDVMQRPIPAQRVSGRGSATSDTFTKSGSPSNGWVIRLRSTCKVLISALATISNPNLFRANQLGLVNPATVAFELVPFSFLLNWLVNVQEFLDGYTDFLGVNLINPFNTAYDRCLKTENWRITNEPPAVPAGLVTFRSFAYESASVHRYSAFPHGPTLKVRPPWRVSPKRAANAISLLLQTLKPGH